MSDEKPKRKPRAVLESGLPPDLKARLDRATDKTLNPGAPTQSSIIRRGVFLVLEEYDATVQTIARELAEARGLKADFSLAHAADTPEGQIYSDALRIASILIRRHD